MAVVKSTGIQGAYFTKQSNVRRAGGPDGYGVMKRTIVGANASTAIGGAGNLSPLVYLPESMSAFADNWCSSLDRLSFMSYATTDGAVGGKWFVNLTNGGTALATSAQTGYDGMITSTCGAVSGNTNSWLGYEAGLPIANRIYWATIRMYLPVEATASLYDIWFGFTNKPATPSAPSPVVDGAWYTIIGTNGVGTLSAYNSKASAASSTLAGLPTLAASSSIELGVIHQGQVGTDFYYRIPSTAPTFVASDQWKFAGSLSAAVNLPSATAILRPYFAHIARSTAASAITVESMKYGIEHSVVY